MITLVRDFTFVFRSVMGKPEARVRRVGRLGLPAFWRKRETHSASFRVRRVTWVCDFYHRPLARLSVGLLKIKGAGRCHPHPTSCDSRRFCFGGFGPAGLISSFLVRGRELCNRLGRTSCRSTRSPWHGCCKLSGCTWYNGCRSDGHTPASGRATPEALGLERPRSVVRTLITCDWMRHKGLRSTAVADHQGIAIRSSALPESRP